MSYNYIRMISVPVVGVWHHVFLGPRVEGMSRGLEWGVHSCRVCGGHCSKEVAWQCYVIFLGEIVSQLRLLDGGVSNMVSNGHVHSH